MTKKELKEYAYGIGIDLMGIAPIERFSQVAPQHNPTAIFPQAKTVVVLAREIPRGTFRGVEEGTLWIRAGRQIPPVFVYNLARYIENMGWIAVPVSPISQERWPDGAPFEEGKIAPNISPSLEYAAVAAGLGEIGYCGIFLNSKFGSRLGLGMIITDMAVEADPVFSGEICERELCLECVKSCPLNAFNSGVNETVDICGKKMVCGVINYDICRMCPNGVFPDTSYREGKPNRLTALCNRTCMAHLESTEKLEKKYNIPFRKREPWKLEITDV